VDILLLKDSRLGERAFDRGKLFQTDIVLGKKEHSSGTLPTLTLEFNLVFGRRRRRRRYVIYVDNYDYLYSKMI
jgi:hypothetical protein